MASFYSDYFPKDLLSSLSAEVLYIILSYLPAKSLLNVSECNRRLRDLCQNCNSLWKHLCKVSPFPVSVSRFSRKFQCLSCFPSMFKSFYSVLLRKISKPSTLSLSSLDCRQRIHFFFASLCSWQMPAFVCGSIWNILFPIKNIYVIYIWR